MGCLDTLCRELYSHPSLCCEPPWHVESTEDELCAHEISAETAGATGAFPNVIFRKVESR
jgi:hypothetical protein